MTNPSTATPRTDAFADDIPPGAAYHTRSHYDWLTFARQLERELAEVRLSSAVTESLPRVGVDCPTGEDVDWKKEWFKLAAQRNKDVSELLNTIGSATKESSNGS